LLTIHCHLIARRNQIILVRRDSVSGNLVDKNAALSMLDLVNAIQNVTITYGGQTYTYNDVGDAFQSMLSYVNIIICIALLYVIGML
jgi:hypothetical protein